jgi:hypothetical protein
MQGLGGLASCTLQVFQNFSNVPILKNHSYKHNEQINSQNIDNSECFGVKFVKIYPEMTNNIFFLKYGFG